MRLKLLSSSGCERKQMKKRGETQKRQVWNHHFSITLSPSSPGPPGGPWGPGSPYDDNKHSILNRGTHQIQHAKTFHGANDEKNKQTKKRTHSVSLFTGKSSQTIKPSVSLRRSEENVTKAFEHASQSHFQNIALWITVHWSAMWTAVGMIPWVRSVLACPWRRRLRVDPVEVAAVRWCVG